MAKQPTCVAVTKDAHRHRFGVAPIPGFGSPADGAAFVQVYKETIRNGKLVWKRVGEARFHSHSGLHAIPFSLSDSSTITELENALRALPDSVWL